MNFQRERETQNKQSSSKDATKETPKFQNKGNEKKNIFQVKKGGVLSSWI